MTHFQKFTAALAGVCLLVGAKPGEADQANSPTGTSLRYSERMLDRQGDVTGKVGIALRARQSGEIGTLTFGGRLFATIIAERTNTAGKFPILSRLPPTHTSGTSDVYGVVNEATVHATLALPMVTAFAQAEYTEVEYPGQDALQLRKYWVALGDLDRSPFYLAVGRKTVNFGNFATYAPFTHSHSNHYFWAQSKDPVIEVGYLGKNTDLAFSLIPGHRGLRVVDSPDNDGDYENYALNLAHRMDLKGGMQLQLGGGYLRGTIYDSAIAHHPPSAGTARLWNGAYNMNATLSADRYDLMAEFTKTTGIWPATGHKVSALTLQGRYRSELFGKPATYSLSLSRGVQGAKGTEWEKMDQAVLGVELDMSKHLKLGAEYMFNDGFVPLIMPKAVGDAGVQSHTLIIGAKLTF
jgi:opacity protein-like surface antigen